jgi:hypothetical protein
MRIIFRLKGGTKAVHFDRADEHGDLFLGQTVTGAYYGNFAGIGRWSRHLKNGHCFRQDYSGLAALSVLALFCAVA